MHVNVAPPVSSVTVAAPQPVALVAPAGSYDHDTVTFDLNQPPHPPPLHDGLGGPGAACVVEGDAAQTPTTTSASQTSRVGLMRFSKVAGR